jgi:hypothetical protein
MTDQELDQILDVTRTIPQEHRAIFLEAVGHALANSADSGFGVVERAIHATRRNLFEPRLTATMVIR